MNLSFSVVSAVIFMSCASGFGPSPQLLRCSKTTTTPATLLNAGFGTGEEEDESKGNSDHGSFLLGENNNHHQNQNRRDLFKKAALAAIFSGATATAFPGIAVATNDDDIIGPLANLVGKWEGDQGFVMLAVPAPGSIPSDQGDFKIIQTSYRENFEIQSIGAVLQRGGSIDQTSGVCTYEKTVWETESTDVRSKQAIIHKENGMLFYLDNVTPNGTPNPADPTNLKPPFSIGRSAVVPHGNTAMMFGDSTDSSGPPTIQPINAFPFTTPTQRFRPSYFIPYVIPPKPTTSQRPTTTLMDALNNGPTVTDTVHFALDSNNGGGGVLNTNFVTERADTRNFKADFWVETVGTGKNDKQLQYAESAGLFFHRVGGWKKDITIEWPHVFVNTLKKVDKFKK